MKKHIPNLITCGNLLCGCLGIAAISEHNLMNATYYIFLGIALDFLDGLAARLLKAYSEIGKQLDSLADMVTFGVLPSFVLYELMSQSFLVKFRYFVSDNQPFWASVIGILPYLAFLIAVFSALRLAKFNLDTRQIESFVGLPTPASALVIASLPLIILQYPDYQEIMKDWFFLAFLTALLSGLMVAEIPLFSLKFKNLAWRGNEIRLIFLGICIFLILALQWLALPLAIFLYVGMAMIDKPK
ncbi:MAG: CDP-diacylglycerol--serine O-phosphatidyltransferase [Microscillaceae bacterium]|jgi:CDP-diacylglycerol--serine O-phosphatidyltransferase|nr:CDP-diacylglycerol--serine O-phosphatidyltransferase [Microscillaceae bacterium]